MNDDNMTILYRESDFVVIAKKSGFLAVPGRGEDMQDAVSSRIQKMFPDCIPQPAVHRLDMDTSGIMILALTKEVHRNLSIQFQNRVVKKRYEALLDGVVKEDEGTIELPFRLDPDNRPYQVYDEVHGKMGLTFWRKIGFKNGLTRIEFRPHTGRTHQLRLHAAHEKGLATPIVGDRLYGKGTAPGQLKLHAAELTCLHPHTGREMNFQSPTPW